MARDYKPVKPKRRPIGRARSGFPGWLGLVCGLALGLGVAGIVYLKDHKLDAQGAYAQGTGQTKSVRRRPRNTETPEASDSAGDEPEKKYDFYDQLPKFEVIVPERDKDVHADIKYAPETRRGTYVLQAGSYRNAQDADRARAKLALQGVESKVQKISVDDRDTWYRIRIGPISKLDDLNRMRQTLRKADVDVMVVRVGD